MSRTLIAGLACLPLLVTGTAIADGMPGTPPATAVETADSGGCQPTSLRVYFQNGEAVLSEYARSAIAQKGAMLEGCAIARMDVLTVASDGRSDTEAAELAAARARSVLAALSDEGVSSQDIMTLPAVRSPASRPMARQVEVRLAAYRPDIS